MTKKAILTGASRGLGAALATQLHSQGWDVLEISRSAGERVDLASPQAVTQWLAGGVIARHLQGATEVLAINNAGTVAPVGASGTLDVAEIQAAVQLNILAPIAITEAVLAARPAEVPTRIVHISSGAGRRPVAGWAVYCATKAAIDMHAQALAAENLPNLRVAAIAPGVVDTDMQGEIRESDFPGRDYFRDLKTGGGLSTPADAAAAICTLIDRDDFGTKTLADVRDS